VNVLFDLLEKDDGRFTPWEQEFIENMKEKLDKYFTFTEAQISKIHQIYEERVENG
jgi:SPX domain protein involved in polyphosphate accumulation